MPSSRVTMYTDMIKYDGTNSADFLAQIPPYTGEGGEIFPVIENEVDGVLTLRLTTVNYGVVDIVLTAPAWAALPNVPGSGGLIGMPFYNFDNPIGLYFEPYLTPGDIGAELLADETFVGMIVAEVPAADPVTMAAALLADETFVDTIIGQVPAGLTLTEIKTALLADNAFVGAIVDEVPDPQVLHYQVGKAALPALLLNGTTTPVVVFDTAMPDDTYEIRWRAVAGASVLAAIVANGAVTKTASQVTIPLRAQGLATVAGVLLVEVFKLA